MKNFKPFGVLLPAVALLLASCVSVPKWQTASGNPEVLISGPDPHGLVVGNMVANQWTIEKQTPNLITFERQKLSTANRALLAIGGDLMGVIEGWNITFVPSGSGSGTRAVLSSVYTNSKKYGKSTNPPTQQSGNEFISMLSGL